ncbi:hypothetical protein LEP1GSC043_1446 [Leptospira weilii str. Ecochallenge]|uniref:Uncharacterized protein n=1 Tax=Leptospira weilii str. Ecochallenge TaxID=1049986 RepID=N1UC99_9LEPT|nr:hypothetical protein LEP1GSC043_1446 [Leptospira weilii str. Ecochallenge]
MIEDFYRLFRLYNKPPEYFYSVFLSDNFMKRNRYARVKSAKQF